MALNVAFPLSGLLPESLYERFGLISPIPQDFEEDLELLVTPYGSSESGIGSSNDSKVNTLKNNFFYCWLYEIFFSEIFDNFSLY